MCTGADHPDDLRSEWLAIRAEVLKRGVSLDEADDVTQEIVALLHTAQGDRQEAKEHLLRMLSGSHICKTRRRHQMLKQAAVLFSSRTAPSAEERALSIERTALVAGALESLGKTQPKLHDVLSRHLEGDTMDEIATELGLPLGTVTTLLRRARDKSGATVRRSMAEDAGRTERARFTRRGRKR